MIYIKTKNFSGYLKIIILFIISVLLILTIIYYWRYYFVVSPNINNYELAISTKNYNLCDKITDNLINTGCFKEIAISTNNTELCQMIKTSLDRNLCLRHIAVNTNDVGICELMNDTVDQFMCYQDISKNTINKGILFKARDMDKCNSMGDEFSIKNCFRNLATNKRNIIYCFYIMDLKNECYENFEPVSIDECNEQVSTQRKDICLNKLTLQGDYRFCELITDVYLRDSCIALRHLADVSPKPKEKEVNLNHYEDLVKEILGNQKSSMENDNVELYLKDFYSGIVSEELINTTEILFNNLRFLSVDFNIKKIKYNEGIVFALIEQKSTIMNLKSKKESNINASTKWIFIFEDDKLKILDTALLLIPEKQLVNETIPVDTDGDYLPDEWEVQNGMNSNDPNDASLDFDGDGLTNLEEFKVKDLYDHSTDPNNADTDGDGISDKLEIDSHTNPLDPVE